MTDAGERTIYDADSHLMELPDFLSAHASKKFKDRLPNLQEILTGQFDPESHAGKQGHNPENVDKLLALGDALTSTYEMLRFTLKDLSSAEERPTTLVSLIQK